MVSWEMLQLLLVCRDRITFLSPWPSHYLYLEEVIGIDRTEQLPRQWKMSPHKKWIRAVWNLVSIVPPCPFVKWLQNILGLNSWGPYPSRDREKKREIPTREIFFFRLLLFWRSRYRRLRGCVIFRRNACVFWITPFIRMTDCRHEFLK